MTSHTPGEVYRGAALEHVAASAQAAGDEPQPSELDASLLPRAPSADLPIGFGATTWLESHAEVALDTESIASLAVDTPSEPSPSIASDTALASVETRHAGTSRHAAPPNPSGTSAEVQTTRDGASVPVPERASDAALAPRTEHAVDPAQVLRQFRVNLVPELRQATIQLMPAELGRIWIRISVDHDRLRATVRAERKETLEILDRHLPELRASLSQQGIEAQQFDLALGFQDRGASAGGRESQSHEPSKTWPQDSSVELGRAHFVRSLIDETGVDTYA